MPYEIEQASDTAPAGAEGAVIYDGRMGDVASIAITNALLTLLTLGIYRFWGKTRLRRYLWGHISYLGDRVEYTGTAKELLLGFFVILLILGPFAVLSFAIDIYFAANAEFLVGKQVVLTLAILFLIQVAIFRARRYRLSRSKWRGIRGGQTGSAFKYSLMYFGWTIVMLLTVFLTYPFFSASLQRYRTENTWFGDKRLEFDGRGKEMFGSWLIAWLLYPFTLGFSYFWYRAKEFRYFTSKTRLADLTFESGLSGMSVILIQIIYAVIVSVIAGLLFGAIAFVIPMVADLGQVGGEAGLLQATPEEMDAYSNKVTLITIPFMVLFIVSITVVHIVCFVHPLLRAICETLRVVGEQDFSAIAQSTQRSPTRGEGLADTLDVGAI